MLRYDLYTGWYLPSIGTIANVLLRGFDLIFQGQILKLQMSLKWLAKHAWYGFYWFWYLPYNGVIPKVVLCNISLLFQGKTFQMLISWKLFLRIECVVKTLYVVTKSAGGVFLIPFGVALVRVRLACWQLWCEGFKICIYYKWDPHWPIVIFKRNFRSLFGKFNFDSFVWFTILMMRC